ncbi:metallophosphoesterase [Paenibacillus silvae]|uniref:metallophosphoesterase n=1 Tax=Paenibacillus silvae TaxID=1325358 RepID=UPI002005DDF3|nr:metallophosphoesterase [Paenibacillus silvae]MCK6073893.1 metallophosphoesterase [Paenibacillus silvae]MCK6148631.1 metallophosphoesterase [Paenibacillus silvae]MCK6266931.1 metallophosphoesterase [Paenibacillus silvae]
MNRTLMISDIHGCIAAFNQLLEDVHYNPKHDQLILLGDYVDRGPSSKEVVDKVMELVHEHHAVALRGNHDQRFVDLIQEGGSSIQSKFIKHGGLPTLQSYCQPEHDFSQEMIEEAREIIQSNYRHHIDFLSKLPLFYEDEAHIYVHAGLNPDYSEWKHQPERDFMYIKEKFIDRTFSSLHKKVIFGHTKTIDIHGSADVWFAEDKIGIDGGCASGMQLNCLIYQKDTYKVEHFNMS